MLRKLFFFSIIFGINVIGSAGLAGDFIVALKAFKKQDYATAYEEFISLAEAGDIRAQTYIGMMHFNGLAVPRNFESAAHWYEKAAKEGHPHAQFHLGWMYDNGKGLEKNNELAFTWFESAALQGHPRAQNNLGVMYFKGDGVEKDFLLAQMWYMISASKGMPEAIENMTMLKEDLNSKQISQVKQMVRKCLTSNYSEC